MEFEIKQQKVYMEAGVHEGVIITDVKFCVNETDFSKNWVEIHFEKPAQVANKVPEVYVYDTGRNFNIVEATTKDETGKYPTKALANGKEFSPGISTLSTLYENLKVLSSEEKEIENIFKNAVAVSDLCESLSSYIKNLDRTVLCKIKLIKEYYVDGSTFEVKSKVTHPKQNMVDYVNGNLIKVYNPDRDFVEQPFKGSKMSPGFLKANEGKVLEHLAKSSDMSQFVPVGEDYVPFGN